MNALILNETATRQLAVLNASARPDRQLVAAALKDGRFVLNTDLLSDAGPGQTWNDYAGFLQSLAQEPQPRQALLAATDRPELLAAAPANPAAEQT
jgi:hypothetical protein